jgi:hypothetical protein
MKTANMKTAIEPGLKATFEAQSSVINMSATECDNEHIEYLMRQDPDIITVGDLDAPLTSLCPAMLQSVMSALAKIGPHHPGQQHR